MCGRFSLEIDDTFYPRYEIKNVIEIKPNFNVSPFTQIPVITKNSPKQIKEMIWGFIPSWAKEYNRKFASINTRSETIDTKSYFKDAFLKYRCLIPATGYFEWKHIGKDKYPYYIHLTNTKYFSLAGIYSIWISSKGTKIYTCSIVTTKPNIIVEKIHDRMPVILSPEDEDVWLDNNIKDINILKSLLRPYLNSDMDAYIISDMVNTPRNNKKEILTPV